jgi:hypothetical protein
VLDGTSSPPATFTLTNYGATATTAITDTLTGANPAQYHITSDTCTGLVLAAQASCTIEVTFAPTLPGVRTATLAVHAATGGTAGANLSGAGNAFTVNPRSHDYGFVVDGLNSAPTIFTVTNHSTSAVRPAVGSLGFPFTITANACRGVTLAPGARCAIAARFSPFATNLPENDGAGLSVTSAPGVITTAGLSGTGTPVAILPLAKNYGTVRVGSRSSAKFTIVNVTSAALDAPFYRNTVTGSGFSITSDRCNGITLAAHATCTITVTFIPTSKSTTYHGELTPTLALYGYLGANEAPLVGRGG